jgi:hypothetical protein
MFEPIIDSIYAQLQMKINPSQTRWSYFELTNKNADEAIRKIFMLRYEDLFIAEKKRIQSAPSDISFQYHTEAMEKNLDRLIDELKKNFLIPKNDIEKTLRDTLLVKLQFITMPLFTIEGMLFHDAAARRVEEIVAKFREFEKFRYYPDALEKYAHAKKISHLTKGQLRLLITEINQSLFGKDDLENVLKLCGLIMKEINDLQGKPAHSIEIEIMMKAFADRSLRDYEVALNIEKELGNAQINLYGLRQVLNRFAILKEKRVSAGAAETAPPAKTQLIAEKQKDTTDGIIETVLKEDESGELIDLNQILAKKPQKELMDNLRPPEPEHQISIPAIENASDVTGEFAGQELARSFSDDTAAIRLTALKESDQLVLIQTLISPMDEKIILKTIFSDHAQAYKDFISVINRTKTWKEAIAVLDDQLASSEVDPFSKEAVRLSDIVYTRYYPPDNANGN